MGTGASYASGEGVPNDVLLLLRQLLLDIALEAAQQEGPKHAVQPLHNALQGMHARQGQI